MKHYHLLTELQIVLKIRYKLLVEEYWVCLYHLVTINVKQNHQM